MSPDIGVQRVGARLHDLYAEQPEFFEDGVRGFTGVVSHAKGQALETLVEFLSLGLTAGKQSEPTRVDGAIHEVGILRAAVKRNCRGHARLNGHSRNILLRDTVKDSRVADSRGGDGPGSNIPAAKKVPRVGDSEKQERKKEKEPA